MRMMVISRRRFLSQAALAVASTTVTSVSADEALSVSYASAFTDYSDQHYVGLFSASAKLIRSYKVASRGHAGCFSKDGRFVVFFARRPGTWILVVALKTGKVFTETGTVSGRHFYGHGVFNKDQSLLFVSENDYDNARGVIGVYEVAQGFKRVREFDSYGVGPHELALLSDDKTLVVANGGIETHPDYGRIKLNITTMSPRLSYIDSSSGQELKSVFPPHHQLSLRHLDVNDRDHVVVGAQFQGGGDKYLPLMFHHYLYQRSNEALRVLKGQPEKELRQLNKYIASVSFSRDGQTIISTSPRGDRVSIWRLDSGWQRDVMVGDVGGVTPMGLPNYVMLSSGNGQIFALSLSNYKATSLGQHKHRWDNHLLSV